MKIVFLGRHKGLFTQLAQWFNDDPSYGITVLHKYRDTNGVTTDETVIEPDIIAGIGSNIFYGQNDFWKGVSRGANTKILKMGSSAGSIAYGDTVLLEVDHWSSCTPSDEMYLPKGKYTFLPLPIDIDAYPVADLTDNRPIKIMQGVSVGSVYKYCYIFRDVAKELGIEYEACERMARIDYLTKISSECMIFADNLWRGQISLSGIEALAMGIPVIGHFSQTRLYDKYNALFGSEPPTIGIAKTADVGVVPFVGIHKLMSMSLANREDLVKPELISMLSGLTRQQIIDKGAECRQWMLTNFSKKNIMDKYKILFEEVLNG